MWNAILINIKWKLFSKIENEIESAPSRHMIFISCQWKIRLYIECIAGDSPKRNICDICASVCVCCAHMQCELYKNRILNEVIRRGEAYAEKTSMELCIFFSCKWYGGFPSSTYVLLIYACWRISWLHRQHLVPIQPS